MLGLVPSIQILGTSLRMTVDNMVFNSRRSRLKRRLGFAVLACAVVGYFCYHAVYGEHGIIAGELYEKRVSVLRNDLQGLRTQRQDLEHRIALLNPESIDPDMLEERVRETLNMSHPRDVVIMRR